MDSFGARYEDIYLSKNFKISRYRLNLFKHYVELRTARYPLQYILKNAEFMGLSFTLDEGVFIPRPETELLVEKVIEYIKLIGKNEVNVFEIGTGCGNIAISLTKNVTGCKILASDISDKALRVASRNARFPNVENNIEFVKSNFFENLPNHYINYFDIILSNPPYVRKSEIGYLQPEISYEDVISFDGGEDGLYFYKRILNDGAKYLKKDGIFAFEIGYDQREEIARLTKNDGRFSVPVFFKDYSGYERVVTVRMLGESKIG
jgi:release factor glutamine methyltransferase